MKKASVHAPTEPWEPSAQLEQSLVAFDRAIAAMPGVVSRNSGESGDEIVIDLADSPEEMARHEAGRNLAAHMMS